LIPRPRRDHQHRTVSMKKSVLILNISFLLALLVSAVCVLALGRSYTLHSRVYIPGAELQDVSMTCENEGVITLTDTRVVDNEILLDLAAAGRGRTAAVFTFTLRYTDGETRPHTFTADLRVLPPGVIVDRTGGVSFSGFRLVIYTILFLLLMTDVVMLWSFYHSWKHGDFSYSLVLRGGLGIFAAVLLLFTVYKLLNNVVNTFSAFLTILHEIGIELLVILTPVMLLMAVFLFLSNLRLMRHEGYRPVNTLGIVFAVLWFAGTLLTVGRAGFYTFSFLPDTVFWILIYVQGYLESMFLSTALCAFLATRRTPPFDRDCVIILGCGIRRDGSLTPLLQGRVDSALAFEQAQYDKTGRHALFVPSGGQGPDEVISEAEAMERYLLSRGVPAERIAREDRSTNTRENMAFSKAVIEGRVGDIAGQKVAFATTNYHVFRGYILARQCGFAGQGISAPTKTYFYPNAFLREFIGLLVDQKWRHLSYVAVTVLFFLTLGALF